MTTPTGDAGVTRTCPICGETAPEPAWLCLPRLMGEAPDGKPCSYSVEGHARATKRMQAAVDSLVSEVQKRAALIARSEEADHAE